MSKRNSPPFSRQNDDSQPPSFGGQPFDGVPLEQLEQQSAKRPKKATLRNANADTANPTHNTDKATTQTPTTAVEFIDVDDNKRLQLYMESLKAQICYAKTDTRWWIPKFWREYTLNNLYNKLELAEKQQAIVQLQAKKTEKAQAILGKQQEIKGLEEEITEINQQVANKKREMLAGSRKDNTQGEMPMSKTTNRNNNLHSLLMMIVALIVFVMIGVFLYLSPFSEKAKVQRPSPELNKSQEVVMLGQPQQQGGGTRLYELPNEQEQAQLAGDETNAQPLTKPKAKAVEQEQVVESEQAEESDTPAESQITVVEEQNETYDDIKITPASTRFYIRFGVHQDQASAEAQKDELTANGVDVRVARRSLPDGSDVFLVATSPIANKEVALDTEQQYRNSGYTSVMVIEEEVN